MHIIGRPNLFVRCAGLFFFATFISASPLVVASTLTISGSPPTSAVVGKPWGFSPKVTGGNGKPLKFSITHQPWWTGFYATTGYLNGTPTAQYVGWAYDIVISVTDGTTWASLPSFNIAIAAAAKPPTIAGKPATSVVAGHEYAFTPTASKGGAGGTLSFSVANKPAWASFSIATGELSGKPTSAQEGKYSNITISVSNGKAKAALPAFAIVVSAPYTAPTITGSPAKSVVAGQTYAFKPKATVESGKKATFSITDKPKWASFSATTGELSGTPAAANIGTNSNIIISVSDGAKTAALPAFAITVTQVGTKSATLSWRAPTSNSNGSALTNLAGYRICWGTSSAALTHTVTINSVGRTTEVITNLGSGTYYFAILAFNAAGVQSKLSNVVSARL